MTDGLGSSLQGCVFLVNSVFVSQLQEKTKAHFCYFYTYMIQEIWGSGGESENGLVLHHLESRESLFYSLPAF